VHLPEKQAPDEGVESFQVRSIVVERTAVELAKGDLQSETGRQVLLQTRNEVERGWRTISEILNSEGQRELAADARRFIEKMPLPRTEKEQIGFALSRRIHQPRKEMGMSR
jgi:hypothetical protein